MRDCLSHFFFPISRLLPETLGAGGSDTSAEITGRFSSVLFINIKVDTGRVGGPCRMPRPNGVKHGYVSKYKTVSSDKAKFLKKKSVNVKCRRQKTHIYPKT